jgi:dTDP-4-amino-4,6-dideoxygalactose transaminase
MPVQFFSLEKQTAALRKEIDQAMAGVLDSGSFILGKNVAAFEEEAAKYCHAKFAIAVASGTDALTLSLKACGIGPGDEVITVPFTFVASIESIVYLGARPVFVDIEPKTFCIDTSQIEAKLTPKTRAILPVHLYGSLSDMDTIQKIAQKYRLKVIEDAAQAIGATRGKHRALSSGDVGATSFFPTKNLGCFGDGGLITTNDAGLTETIRALRNHGSTKTYVYDYVGYNSRLDELQAAVLRVKLKKLDEWHRARNTNASLYLKLLKDVKEVVLPATPQDGRHVFNQFTLRAQKRDQLREHLKNQGIGSMIYYPLSLHKMRAYEFLGQKNADFPECSRAEKEVLSLPIYPELSPEDLHEVCAAIKEFYA